MTSALTDMSGFARIERWSNARFFKECSDGRLLFFPGGRRGQGFLVPSRADWQALRRRVAIMTLLGPGLPCLPAALVFAFLGPHAVVLRTAALGAICFVVGVWCWIVMTRRRLTPVEDRLLVEEVREQRQGLLTARDWAAAFAVLMSILAITSSGVIWLSLGPPWGIGAAALGVTAATTGGLWLLRPRRLAGR